MIPSYDSFIYQIKISDYNGIVVNTVRANKSKKSYMLHPEDAHRRYIHEKRIDFSKLNECIMYTDYSTYHAFVAYTFIDDESKIEETKTKMIRTFEKWLSDIQTRHDRYLNKLNEIKNEQL